MNIKKALLGVTALAVSAAIVGCDQAPAAERIRPTQDIPNFTVRLNIVPERDIRQVCEKLGVPYDANGCNAFHTPQNFCDIYVVMPSSVGDEEKMATVGHELLHCRYGRYHE